jgi:hypothetical protein
MNKKSGEVKQRNTVVKGEIADDVRLVLRCNKFLENFKICLEFNLLCLNSPKTPKFLFLI